MKNRKWALLSVLSAAVLVAAYGQMETLPAAATNLVRNGSFENPKNTWMDTNCNYMSLLAGSTAIPGWTVTSTTDKEIVWAMTPTCDGHTAAKGTFFLDLTGFGSDSPSGGVQQTLHHLTIGQQYTFSVDVETDGMLPLVTVDNVNVPLTAGKPFTRGSDVWTPQRGTFTAESASAVLTIQNQQVNEEIDFIDNVVIKEK